MVEAKALLACLPQLQCQRCGFAGCAPYAEALANQKAPCDLCEPGGLPTAQTLAKLLSAESGSPSHLPEAPVYFQGQTAYIHESACIGCTLCIRVCPTDAIIGAIHQMHTIVSDACSGCRLCEPVCPTQCIEILPNPQHRLEHFDQTLASHTKRAQIYEERFHSRQNRLIAQNQQAQREKIQKDIQASLERVRQKRRSQDVQKD